MGVLANVIPTLKITGRLSCSSNTRNYTSLVQVLQCHRYNNSLQSCNLNLQRFYSVDKYNNRRNRFRKASCNRNRTSVESTGSFLPIALIDLNPSSVNSTKVLLIPLNWQDGEENVVKNTITSIFDKGRNLRQIKAFSQALGEISHVKTGNQTNFQNIDKQNRLKDFKETVKQNKELKLEKSQKNREISENVGEKQKIVKNIEATKDVEENIKQENSHDNVEEELTEITVPTRYALGVYKNCSLDPLNESFMNHLDRLAAAVEIALQKCCLESIQMSLDSNLLGQIYFEGLTNCPTKTESESNKATELSDRGLKSKNNDECLSMSSIIKINTLKLNSKEIGCDKQNPFAEIQSSTVIRKSCCSKTNTIQQKVKSPCICSVRKSVAASMLPVPLKRSSHSDKKIKPSDKTTPPKCKSNCNLPLLSNLFGAEELLMSCDAYNKALIEAFTKREALAKVKAQLKKIKEDSAASRQQVMSIKGCSDTSSTSATKASKPCPPPVKQFSKGDSKKDDSCKTPSPQLPSPCKDELEKLKYKQNQDSKNKKNKIPTGCTSPKCEKDDSKLQKTPCQKPTDYKSAAPVNSTMKRAKDNSKKENPCKPAESPNPCKGEMEKLKSQKDEDAKKNKNKMPEGCISPKCKKDDGCGKLQESPCKKASKTIKSPNPAQKSSTFNIECAKGSGKDRNNPCSDEHKEYKPKCNKDPCIKDSDPCGGKSKEEDTKKQEPCKRKNTTTSDSKKEDPCTAKKEDPGKKKENPCGGCKPKENSAKNMEKKDSKDDPLKKSPKKEEPFKKNEPGNINREEPCKKEHKEPSAESKQKEDLCKKKVKNDPKKEKVPIKEAPKKDDPCKIKERKDPFAGNVKKEDTRNKREDKDSCGGAKQKEDACKEKEQKDSSEGSKQKEDSCKRKEKKDPKEDPNKKSPSKDDTSQKKDKKDTCVRNKKAEDSCKKKENKDSFVENKQKEDPCKNKENKEPKEEPCKAKKGPKGHPFIEGPTKGDHSKNEEKKSPCVGNIKKEDPCKKKDIKDQCGKTKQKEDPKQENKDEKKNPIIKAPLKDYPCKKEEKKYPCAGNVKQENTCQKKDKKEQKEDPCKIVEKKDPCGKAKQKEDPCGKDKLKEDPCKKIDKKDLGGESKKIEEPCKKKTNNPCEENQKKGKPSPCSSRKKEGPSEAKIPSSHSPSSKIPCGEPKRETKPNCSNIKKYFSTLSLPAAKKSHDKVNRSFTSLTGLPKFRNKNMDLFGFVQHFSSKGGKGNKKNIDYGKQSICKSMAAVIPPKRKSAYNPHPEDGLRKCYPTYDMDCRKICKEPRQTACNRYSFLKDTDNHKRKGCLAREDVHFGEQVFIPNPDLYSALCCKPHANATQHKVWLSAFAL